MAADVFLSIKKRLAWIAEQKYLFMTYVFIHRKALCTSEVANPQICLDEYKETSIAEIMGYTIHNHTILYIHYTADINLINMKYLN